MFADQYPFADIVSAKLDEKCVSIIVAPFVAIINDQIRAVEKLGILTQKFTFRNGVGPSGELSRVGPTGSCQHIHKESKFNVHN